MNASDMLDFSIDQLEGSALARARREAADSPELRESLERLRSSTLVLLGDRHDDDDAYPPPPGLAARTLAHVVHEAKRRASSAEPLAPVRRFGLGDLAMAATIFLASILALAPAVLRSRETWDRAACSNNLREIGLKFHQYAAIKNEYPFVPADGEVPHAGAMLIQLEEARCGVDHATLHCPSRGPACSSEDCTPNEKVLAAMEKTAPEQVGKAIHGGDYAMNIGHRHADGRPGPATPRPSARIPIAADSPLFEDSGRIVDGNSPNHGGRGQNVLFSDGHTAWFTSRSISPEDRDLYLNDDNRPAYGVNASDSVLLAPPSRVFSR